MQSFYKYWLREKLERYVEVKETYGKLLDEIAYLEGKLEGKAIASYGESLGHNQGQADERFLNQLAELDALKANYKENMKLIDDVDKATDCLNDMESEILFTLYGTRRRGGKARSLADKYQYEERQIYRIGEQAASKVSYRLFGNK